MAKVSRQIDLQEIELWAKSHNLGGLAPELLPPTGAWVPGVAALWVYITNGNTAYLDCFIANPESREVWDFAPEIVLECMQIAREHGCKIVSAFTPIPNIVRVGKELGASVKKGHFMYRSL